MAQGSSLKAAAKKKSKGAQKRLASKQKKTTAKGKRVYSKFDLTTKRINKKNETIIAAKAMSVTGNNAFFCSDLVQKGQRENNKLLNARAKKEKKKATQRLQQQMQR